MQMNCIDGGVLCSSMHTAHSLHRNCQPHFILPHSSVSFQAYLKQVGICSCNSHYGGSHLLPFSFFFSCNSCPAIAHHRSQVLLSQYLVSLLLDRGAIFCFYFDSNAFYLLIQKSITHLLTGSLQSPI